MTSHGANRVPYTTFACDAIDLPTFHFDAADGFSHFASDICRSKWLVAGTGALRARLIDAVHGKMIWQDVHGRPFLLDRYVTCARGVDYLNF